MLFQDGWQYGMQELLIKEENRTEVEAILSEVFSTDLVWPERERELKHLRTRLKEIGELQLYKNLKI